MGLLKCVTGTFEQFEKVLSKNQGDTKRSPRAQAKGKAARLLRQSMMNSIKVLE